jgi:hypothetical protein
MPVEAQKGAWLNVGLLLLFMMINFADKAVISIAAVPMMQELNLSPREFGLIGSSFTCCSRSRPSRRAFSSTGLRRAGCCWRWG